MFGIIKIFFPREKVKTFQGIAPWNRFKRCNGYYVPHFIRSTAISFALLFGICNPELTSCILILSDYKSERAEFCEVLQQTPRAVTVAPPSEVTFPPLVAEFAVIELIDVVVMVGNSISCSVVKVTSLP